MLRKEGERGGFRWEIDGDAAKGENLKTEIGCFEGYSGKID